MLLPHLLVQFSFDNDLMHSMAKQWYSYGLKPYVSTWDQNFPGVVYIHYIAILLFGKTEVGFRLIDILTHAAIAGLTFSILRRWIDAKIAFAAVLTYLTIYYGQGLNLAGQRDAFAVLGIVISMKFFIDGLGRESISGMRLMLAGALSALAISIRPTYGLFALVFATLLLLYAQTKWKSVAIYVASCFAGLVLLLGPWLFDSHARAEFIRATITFNLDVYAGFYRMKLIDTFRYIPEVYTNVAFITLAVVIYRAVRKRDGLAMLGYPSRKEWVVLTAIYCSLRLPIWLMGKFYIYHYEAIMPFTAGGLAVLGAFFIRRMPRMIGALYLPLLFIALLVAMPWKRVAAFGEALMKGDEHPLIQAHLAGKNGPRLTDEQTVAEYINRDTAQGGIILLVTDGAYPWRIERPLISRFNTFYGLGMRPKSGEFTSYQRSWHSEVGEKIASREAAFVIVDQTPKVPFLGEPPSALLPSIPMIFRPLHAHYEEATTIGDWKILKRRL